MSFVLDSHSHYFPPEIGQNTMFFKVGWSDVDRQLKCMDEQSIEKSLLLYPTSDAHLNMGGSVKVCQVYNEKISELVDSREDRFVGAGIIPADSPSDIASTLSSISNLNLSALSVASSYDGIYLDDERFDQVYEWATKQKMPIHIHPQIINPIGEDRVKDPLLTPVLEYVMDVTVCLGKMMMSGTFLKFPDVKFIFAHYGGVLPLVKERFDNTYQMLRKREFVKDLTKLPGEFFKNLYFDTSGSKSQASLLAALEVTDASHILYGSDYPANQDMPGSIGVIDQINISDQDKALIRSSNFQSLFLNQSIVK